MTLPTYTSLDQMQASVPNPFQGVVVSNFRQSQLLDALMLREVGGAGLQWRRQVNLPDAGTRSLNEDFTKSSGKREVVTSPLKIYGGRVSSDRAGTKMGVANPVEDLNAVATSTRLKIEGHLIKGDPDSDPEQMAGLQYLAANSGDSATVMSAGSGSGGEALSLRTFRDAIDRCDAEGDGMKLAIMSQQMLNIVAGGAENTSVSGYLVDGKDSFGRKIKMFDDVRLIAVEYDETNTKILDFNEAAASGSSTATSIYIVKIGMTDGYVPFIHESGFDVPVPEADGVFTNRDLEVLIGAASVHVRGVVRLQHIGNASMVR